MARFLISGGGTGGHIFPALSIANAIRRHEPEAEILFVGALGRMEMERVPAAGYRIEGLPVAGFDRKRLWRNFAVMIRLWKSLRKAKRILREFRPDICIGVGGYASGPMLKAAQRRGIPTVLQEQNSYAGVTNRLLAAKAKSICVAYPGMERFFPAEKVVLTGNPVRKDILDSELSREGAKQQIGFDPQKPLILVLGGSLGARTINRAVGASIETWKNQGAQVLWQTGKIYAEECAKVAEPYAPEVIAKPFISTMDLAYRAADVVVSRAGAGTISELCLTGKCAVLVPSPNVAEDHQRHNAEALSTRGAAIMILDADADLQLTDTVTSLLNDAAKRETLQTEIKKMALTDSDEKIREIVYDSINS